MKVTLYTNVLVSGTFWEGEAFRILELIEQKKLDCVLSKGILNEYDRIIHSEEILEKVEEKHLHIRAVVIKIVGMCAIVEPKRKIRAVQEDPDDDKIIECAVEGKVDYIITYDSKHLLKLKEFEGIKIISPGEFLMKFEKRE